MKLIYKMWFAEDGAKVFGEGPCLLLKGVELTGSLKRSAAGMGMAYSKARRVIKCCEDELGFPLILRKGGGAPGHGGSVVTAEAFKLMKEYESIRKETEEMIRKAYERHFRESIEVEFYTAAKRTRSIKSKAISPQSLIPHN